MASGIGDWDAVEAAFDLRRCEALRRYWREVAPPAHLSLAALIDFKPKSVPRPETSITNPDELARQLRAMGVMG